MKNTALIAILVAIVISAAVVLELARQTMEETQNLGQCLVEQLVEHRLDNRNTHEALSKEHFTLNPEFQDESLSFLPPPPRGLPEPHDDVQEELVEACRDYLHQDRFSSSGQRGQ